MINYYLIELEGKNIKRLLHQIFKEKINVLEIKYLKDKVILKVSYDNYKRIKRIKTSCKVNIIKINGSKKLNILFKKYQISILIFIMSIFFIIFLSNITFFINIETDNNNLKRIIKQELNNNGITLFSRKKTFKELSVIKNNIKNNNSDKLEWVEFDYKGVCLKVKLIERVKNDNEENNIPTDVVAAKNGYIKNIVSSKGQILKNIDDYVKTGEVIISGNIIRNEKLVDRVHAKGDVYAEVWYIVKLRNNLDYIKMTPSKKSYYRLILKLPNKSISIIKLPVKTNQNSKKVLFKNDLFSLVSTKEKIYAKKHEKYNTIDLSNILKIKAKKAILNELEKDEYIITEKTLKKRIENGKMYMEVFFKVYENIAKEKKASKIIEKKEE